MSDKSNSPSKEKAGEEKTVKEEATKTEKAGNPEQINLKVVTQDST